MKMDLGDGGNNDPLPHLRDEVYYIVDDKGEGHYELNGEKYDSKPEAPAEKTPLMERLGAFIFGK